MKTSPSIFGLFVLKFAIVSAAAGMLAACSQPRDGWVATPEQMPVQVNESSGLLNHDYTPKAEFLFVEDNSDSMQPHIDKVDRNIAQFVNEFSKNNPVEFHFAVVSIYDSRTYQSPTFFKQFGKNAHYYRCGQFHHVKDANDQVIPNKYYISSSDPDWKSELKNTMEIGVQHLNQGGPNYEETFSPVAAVWGFHQPVEFTGTKALQEIAQLNQIREGFSFHDPRAFKVIFFVTDANDDSNISATELYADLKKSTGGNGSRVWGFGAIVPPSCTLCQRDDAGPPYKLERFLKLTNHLPFQKLANGQIVQESNAVSLYSNSFGKDFANWGKSIRNKLVTQVIPLRYVPLIDGSSHYSLRVFYGNQEIPFESSKGVIGYTYDPNNHSIVLDKHLQLQPIPGAKLHIRYTAIPPQAILNGDVSEYISPQ